MPTLKIVLALAAFFAGIFLTLTGGDGWRDMALFGCVMILAVAGFGGWWSDLRT
jgi:hypothetical protein